MTKPRGFTLLEVLLALAILASALTVLLGTAANSSQQAVFANDLTIASQLARSKMIDIEYEIMEEGFDSNDQQLRGDFSREGQPDYTWEANIQVVEIPESAKEEFLAQINTQLFGGDQGALQGNAAFSAMLPMLIAELPTMINNIGKKVRKVDLVIEFSRGSGRFPLKVSQYVIDPKLNEFNVFDDSPALQ
jgi:general secretion pathway protein I